MATECACEVGPCEHTPIIERARVLMVTLREASSELSCLYSPLENELSGLRRVRLVPWDSETQEQLRGLLDWLEVIADDEATGLMANALGRVVESWDAQQDAT